LRVEERERAALSIPTLAAKNAARVGSRRNHEEVRKSDEEVKRLGSEVRGQIAEVKPCGAAICWEYRILATLRMTSFQNDIGFESENEKRAAAEIPTLAAKNAARVGQPAGTIEKEVLRSDEESEKASQRLEGRLQR